MRVANSWANFNSYGQVLEDFSKISQWYWIENYQATRKRSVCSLILGDNENQCQSMSSIPKHYFKIVRYDHNSKLSSKHRESVASTCNMTVAPKHSPCWLQSGTMANFFDDVTMMPTSWWSSNQNHTSLKVQMGTLLKLPVYSARGCTVLTARALILARKLAHSNKFSVTSNHKVFI